MYYCESCRVEKKWPESVDRSVGQCEVCGRQSDCHDVPSSKLPRGVLGHAPTFAEMYGNPEPGKAPEPDDGGETYREFVRAYKEHSLHSSSENPSQSNIPKYSDESKVAPPPSPFVVLEGENEPLGVRPVFGSLPPKEWMEVDMPSVELKAPLVCLSMEKETPLPPLRLVEPPEDADLTSVAPSVQSRVVPLYRMLAHCLSVIRQVADCPAVAASVGRYREHLDALLREHMPDGPHLHARLLEESCWRENELRGLVFEVVSTGRAEYIPEIRQYMVVAEPGWDGVVVTVEPTGGPASTDDREAVYDVMSQILETVVEE